MKKTSLAWGKTLAYARFLVAGGIGGVAVVNTWAHIMATNPTPNAETYAMAIGACLLAGAAKLAHAA